MTAYESGQQIADRIRDRRATEGTLGKPQPVCWRSECRNGCYYPGACSEIATDAALARVGAAR